MTVGTGGGRRGADGGFRNNGTWNFDEILAREADGVLRGLDKGPGKTGTLLRASQSRSAF